MSAPSPAYAFCDLQHCSLITKSAFADLPRMRSITKICVFWVIMYHMGSPSPKSAFCDLRYDMSITRFCVLCFVAQHPHYPHLRFAIYHTRATLPKSACANSPHGSPIQNLRSAVNHMGALLPESAFDALPHGSPITEI